MNRIDTARTHTNGKNIDACLLPFLSSECGLRNTWFINLFHKSLFYCLETKVDRLVNKLVHLSLSAHYFHKNNYERCM